MPKKSSPSLVFRLENHKGKGPFSGGQGMCNQLASHKDPESMIKLMGISQEEFESLTDKGTIFGWKTKELMASFFNSRLKAQKRASEMKMKISIYAAEYTLEFPDGQVLFIRPEKPPVKMRLRDFFSKYEV